MASKAKQVGKGDIRRLMKETKSKINSPLAKYNSAGQLTCILCLNVIKNELQWSAHVNGKVHKDNVADLKSGKESSPVNGTHVATKRKHKNGISSSSLAIPPPTSSKSSSLLPDFFEGASLPKVRKLEKLTIIPLAERKPAGILKNKGHGLVAPAMVPPPKKINSASSPRASTSKLDSLPSDFYDNAQTSVSSSSSVKEGDTARKKGEKSKDSKNKKHQASTEKKLNGNDIEANDDDLPEGFFDDPVEDAKVHHKQYVDPLDAQWELFQKEIKMEAYKSEVIEIEDDDVMIFKRTLSEIDDQLESWAKVEALHIKKEAKFIKIEIKEEGEEGTMIAATGSGEKTENMTNFEGEVQVKIEPEDDVKREEEEAKKEDGNDGDDDDNDGEESSDDEDDFDELLDWRSKGT